MELGAFLTAVIVFYLIYLFQELIVPVVKWTAITAAVVAIVALAVAGANEALAWVGLATLAGIAGFEYIKADA